jgi:glycosyltransferase involved in cell wall biosynthesis
LKVLQTWCYTPAEFPGGLENYVLNLSQALVRRGHDVTFIASNPMLEKTESWSEGVRILKLPSVDPARHLGRHVPIMPTFPLELSHEHPQIIHTHVPHFIYGAELSVVLARLRKIPSVVTFHHRESYSSPFYARAFFGFYNRVCLPLILKTDAIVCTSKSYFENVPELQKVRSKVHVIPVGVDTNRFTPKKRNLQLRQNLSKDCIVLFVGRLVSYKGLECLVDSARYVLQNYRHVKFVVVGSGILEKTLKDRILRLGLQSVFRLEGRVPESILAAYYASSDVLVFPTQNELDGFGIVQLEAMSSGIPVVATDLPGVKDAVSSTGFGKLVPAGDPASLGNSIVEVLSKANSFSPGQMHETIREVYDWNKVAEKMERLYESLRQ